MWCSLPVQKALKTTDKLQRSKISSRITPIARLHNGCTNIAAIATYMYYTLFE